MNKIIKGVLGVTGAIALSIISTYLYDIIFRGLLSNLTIWILDHFHWYRDVSIYEEVAKGFHNYESQLIFSIIAGFCGGVSLALFVRTFKTRYPSLKTSGVDSKFWGPLLLSIFFFFIIFIQQTQISLINKLTTNYYQKLNIVTPHITSHQRDLFISDFSKIKNKDDYDSLLQKLVSIEDSQNY